jgi:hypothetical protein
MSLVNPTHHRGLFCNFATPREHGRLSLEKDEQKLKSFAMKKKTHPPCPQNETIAIAASHSHRAEN